MIRAIFFLVVPLIVYLISNSTEQSSIIKSNVKQGSEQISPSHKKTNTEAKGMPEEPTSVDNLFLEDEDFDVVDLINANRRSK